jgi:hypothetical protein
VVDSSYPVSIGNKKRPAVMFSAVANFLKDFLVGPEGSERKNFRIETQSTILQPNKEQLLTLAIDQH